VAADSRAGARLAGRLVAAVSRMTLIRLIRALPDPVVEAGVIGNTFDQRRRFTNLDSVVSHSRS
jgi:hypothetical protein